MPKLGAEIRRIWTHGDAGAATTAAVFLVLILATVALAYRSFHSPKLSR